MSKSKAEALIKKLIIERNDINVIDVSVLAMHTYAAGFAEWVAARYNYTHKGWVGWSDVLNEEIYMISAKPDAEYYTTQQLIQKFEEDEKL